MIFRTTAKRFWQLLIVFIMLSFFAAMAISFRLAGQAGSRVVDRDYYEHGKQYEEQAARERNAARAGWRLSYSRRGDALLVAVTDGTGRGVTGAVVQYHPAGVDDGRGFRLQERDGGVYQFSPALSGAARGRLTVARDDCYLQGRLAVVP